MNPTTPAATPAPLDPRVSYPISFVNAVAQYLAERPYKEVANLIAGLERQGQMVPPPADPPAGPSKE